MDSIILFISFILGSFAYRYAFGCNRNVFILENLTKKKTKYWQTRYVSLKKDYIKLLKEPEIKKVLETITKKEIYNILNKRQTKSKLWQE